MIDDLGAEVDLPARPRRVVSLVPSLTEAIESTAPGTVVGATDYCIHPPGLRVPRIGGSKYPTAQAIPPLAPDLVVANAEENRPGDVAGLRAAGIPVWTTAAPATVPAALGSLRRLLCEVLRLPEPAWLTEAERIWAAPADTVRAVAVVPVWRRPWIVLGRDTFAGDLLRRLGVSNAYAENPDRYPRPPLAELTQLLADGVASLVVLPDEPYAFGPGDGPEAFPGARCAFLSGRHLTWYGPSLVEAPRVLGPALASAVDAGQPGPRRASG